MSIELVMPSNHPVLCRSLLLLPSIFIYFWLCWVFIAARVFSLVVASGGYSLVAMRELLIAMTSIVQHRLWGMWASVVVGPKL